LVLFAGGIHEISNLAALRARYFCMGGGEYPDQNGQPQKTVPF